MCILCVCSRLTLLHGLICQGEWRVPSLWHRFVDDVALPIITDTNRCYQNVRSRLGGCALFMLVIFFMLIQSITCSMLGSLGQYDTDKIYNDPALPEQYHYIRISRLSRIFNG